MGIIYRNLHTQPPMVVGAEGLWVTTADGIELVADRESKTPFAAASAIHAEFKKAAMRRGLLTYPGGGCVDGRRGDHVLIAPAFTVSDDEIGEIVDRLSKTFDDMRSAFASASKVERPA